MNRFLAFFYDWLMASFEKRLLIPMRREILSKAKGSGLEIGAGTGANIALYPEAVTDLVLTEPDVFMAERLKKKLIDLKKPYKYMEMRSESLPFTDGEFDFVVSTLVLCSVTSQEKALSEIYRVLKPGGCFYYIEHVASEESKWIQFLQKLINPFWKRFAGNCHLTRHTGNMIKEVGFKVKNIGYRENKIGPTIVRPMIIGCATK